MLMLEKRHTYLSLEEKIAHSTQAILLSIIESSDNSFEDERSSRDCRTYHVMTDGAQHIKG